uniref:EB domain-containing protein n=1 Tax=Plectus sambesii TaxID=2011161 RepID=A0A914WC39_9BILA
MLTTIAVLMSFIWSAANGQTCPNGLGVYIDPTQNAAVPCAPGGACPGGATCQNQPLNAFALQNLCCLGTPAVTTCPGGQVLIGGQCFASAAPGLPCAVLGQCTGGATCIGSICQCAAGQTIVSAVCTTSTVTTCTAGQVLVNGVCVSQVPPGTACIDSSQCTGGSTCVGLVCTCNAGTTISNGICIVNVLPTSPPIVAPSCTATQVLVNGICYDNVGPGVACVVSQQCQFSSTCVTGICTCPIGQANLGGTCAVPGVTTGVTIGTVVTIAPGVTAVGTGISDCPQGSVLLYPSNQQPVVCGLIGQPNGRCPSNYPTCMYSARLTQTVCCSTSSSITGTGSVVATVAPIVTATVVTSATDCDTTNVLMYPGNNQPVVCGTQGSPNGRCPSTHPTCISSARLGYSVCCRTTTG